MMKIDVNTTTATLIPPRESLTPGAVNAVQLEFTFSDEWNGLTKTCVFSNEIETVPAEMQNDITSVPTEVLDEVYRWISVGVSGEDAEGTVIIPTIWCRIGQCIPGASGRFVTIDMLQAYWSKQEIDLHTEGDGSKFLGDDGVYHYVSQGGGDVTHEELDAALALKADKDAFDALSATVDDKADKSEIITVTTGDGTKYLADDGTYKTITGGGDVTHEELDAAIAPLATKDELSTAVEPLATKTELASATAGVATTAAMNAALALKADKSELASYAKQYDVNQALATKADKAETQAALAQKADKSEIITVTTGSGTLFLADDGTYKPAAGDPPDLSAYLTKTEAGTTYATKTELADKADASALADYETTAHAAATYETKADASQVKSITAAGFALTPDSAGNVNVGGTMVSRDSTFGSWGSEATIQIAQTLPAGATPGTNPTPGSSLTIVKRVENSGANPVTKLTVDGVQLATSADIPDVSHFATTDYVQNTFESTQHASATYLKISDAAATYQTIADASPVKSITAGGTAVAPDASGNVALTKSVVSYNENSPSFAFQGYVQQEDTSGNATALQYSYDNDGTKSTNLRFDVSVRQSGGIPSLRGPIRAVTYDEFTDFAATASTVKAIAEGTDTDVLTPDANGTVVTGRTDVSYSIGQNAVSPTGVVITNLGFTITQNLGSWIPSATAGDAPGAIFRLLWNKVGDKYVNCGIPKTNNVNEREVRLTTYDEFVDETKTFTHTYTGDAQDNWTVTDTWSGSDGELQKITWKEYAATAGSPGELIYTGTDSATSQKRSVRIATYAELGDYTSGFATMQWVQEYIASLDGTNMSL